MGARAAAVFYWGSGGGPWPACACREGGAGELGPPARPSPRQQAGGTVGETAQPPRPPRPSAQASSAPAPTLRAGPLRSSTAEPRSERPVADPRGPPTADALPSMRAGHLKNPKRYLIYKKCAPAAGHSSFVYYTKRSVNFHEKASEPLSPGVGDRDPTGLLVNENSARARADNHICLRRGESNSQSW